MAERFRYERERVNPPPRLAWSRRLAWLTLFRERLVAGFWPLPALSALFLALALSDLLPSLPGPLHVVVLSLFVAGAVFLAWRGARGWRWPDRNAIERRLESDGGVRHRPLSASRDEVAPSGRSKSADALAQALWIEHRRRLMAAAAALRVGPPRPTVAGRDPLGLRYAALLLLLVAAVGAGGDWRGRLWAAVTPSLDDLAGASRPVAVVDAWLTPPPATGLAPIFLVAGGTASVPAGDSAAAVEAPPRPITVPAGSMLTARVAGGAGVPDLSINGGARPFLVVDGRGFQIEAAVTRGSRIAIGQGGVVLREWPVEVVTDQPPSVGFVAPPAPLEGGRVGLEYAAEDDYGLASVEARITLDPGAVSAPTATDPHLEPLMTATTRPREAHSVEKLDLTAHPWAGLPVTVTLVARDGGGQVGESGPLPLVLPERVFNHPVARAIIAERRRLTVEGPGARAEVAEHLRDLASSPDAFSGDPVVFLALDTAGIRLLRDRSADAVPEVRTLLWETALRVEDGGLSQAERTLRDARRALEQALERGASEDELRRLMDRMEEAMGQWLDSLEKRAAESDSLPNLPPELADRMTDRGELAEMMDRMREMAETGARDAARRMLSELGRMLDNAQAGASGERQSGDRDKAFDLMRRLRELTEAQRGLLDETFQHAQKGLGEESRPGGSRPGRREGRTASPLLRGQAEKQEAMRRELGDIMREFGDLMGDIPQPLGRAEREMRDAGRALGAGAPSAAVESQTRAVEELSQGMEDMAEGVMRRMTGGSPGMAMGQSGPGRDGQGRDPLGRRAVGDGMVGGDDVEIPTEGETRRARDILDELRRRAGEAYRPRMEREYIDRLLRRF